MQDQQRSDLWLTRGKIARPSCSFRRNAASIIQVTQFASVDKSSAVASERRINVDAALGLATQPISWPFEQPALHVVQRQHLHARQPVILGCNHDPEQHHESC